jgi:hypothetical protein
MPVDDGGICHFALALHDALVFTELARLRDDGHLLLARLRWNLTLEAYKVATLLRFEGIPVTAGNIAIKLIPVVVAARPRSRFVPRGLDAATVEKAIELVAAEVAEARA